MNHAQFWGGDVAPPFEISNSLRFRGAQYLTRTQGTPDDGRKYTLSVWVKQQTGVNSPIVEGRVDTGNNEHIRFRDDGRTFYRLESGATAVGVQNSLAYFRDPSAWYHFVAVFDSASGTAADRYKLFINGVEAPQDGATNIPLNELSHINRNTNTIYIGRSVESSSYMNGYLAEFHFLDGISVTDASDFGQFNADGVWVPRAVSGVTYGTNGFYLDFSDPANIGADRSGNGNNYTPTGFELTFTNDVNYDWMADSPTDNHVVMNPLPPLVGTGQLPTDGNLLRKQGSASTNYSQSWIPSTIYELPSTGKWFLGLYNYTNSVADQRQLGINLVTDPDAAVTLTDAYPTSGIAGILRFGASNYRYYVTENSVQLGDYNIPDTQPGNAVPHGSSVMAYDADTGKVWFGYVHAGPGDATFTGNIVWVQSNGTVGGDPVAGTNPTFTVTGQQYARLYTNRRAGGAYNVNVDVMLLGNNSSTTGVVCNLPAGYEPLNTAALPNAAITNPSNHFTTILDTGANILTAAQSQVPNGLWWIKDRANISNHQLLDSVRGGSLTLYSNVTAIEGTYSAPSGNSVAWCWATPGSSATNNSGTIQSTVDVNTTAGFSIVSYTGNGINNATIGHGLGVTPSFYFVKNRDTAVHWGAWHTGLADSQILQLSSNAIATTPATAYFQPQNNSNTVIALGTNNETNQSGDTYIAYCFAEVEGYSKFGSYSGNGSTDGPMVSCGFKPAWLMIKRYDSLTNNWFIVDSVRDEYNVVANKLEADTNVAEYSITDNELDILSNGFKLRRTTNGTNGSGADYVFAAFAEHPFGGSNVSPATAR